MFADTTADDEDEDRIKEDITVLEDEMTEPVTASREDIQLETDNDGDDEDEMEDTNGDTSKDEKSGLANVMAKILAKQTVKDKPIILSKALSDNQLNLKRKLKEAQEASQEGKKRKDSDDEEDPAKLKENVLKVSEMYTLHIFIMVKASRYNQNFKMLSYSVNFHNRSVQNAFIYVDSVGVRFYRPL